jgi:hypothetical protein
MVSLSLSKQISGAYIQFGIDDFFPLLSQLIIHY